MRSYYILLAFMALLSYACKKNDSNTANRTPRLNYRPHMIDAGPNELIFFDASDPAHPKQHVYSFNSSTGKYAYTGTYDSTSWQQHSAFPYSYFTKWPAKVTDPVLVDAFVSLCGTAAYGNTFIDWNAQDTGYYEDMITYNPRVYGFKTYPFGKSICSVPEYQSIFRGTFGSTLYPGKIDGYSLFYEEPVIVDSSRNDYAWPEVKYYFDFNAGTFFSDQWRNRGYDSALRTTEYLESGFISTLIEKPYGNMTTNPIDFKLADAVFLVSETNVNRFYFIDYDQDKYVEVTRYVKNMGNINQVNTDSAKFNLITTSWQPISDIITGWQF